MTLPHNKGIKRVYRAFFYSLHGFRACFRTEEAFRQEVFLAALMIPAALWIGDTAVERSLLLGCVFITLIAELLNSAVERAIDRISFEKHELSKEAKDMGSAAVMLCLIMTLAIWAMIGLPKIL